MGTDNRPDFIAGRASARRTTETFTPDHHTREEDRRAIDRYVGDPLVSSMAGIETQFWDFGLLGAVALDGLESYGNQYVMAWYGLDSAPSSDFALGFMEFRDESTGGFGTITERDVDALGWDINFNTPLGQLGFELAPIAEMGIGVGWHATLKQFRRLAEIYCFVKGTPVVTPDGLKPIEEVEVGDVVQTRDEETGELVWGEVVSTSVTHDAEVLDLELTAEDGTVTTLGVTGSHRFWVDERGWIPASKMKPGDELFSSRGGWLRVTGSTWRAATETVYNFEVAEHHTYFVGEVQAWTHNICPRQVREILEFLEPRMMANGPNPRLLNEMIGLAGVVESGRIYRFQNVVFGTYRRLTRFLRGTDAQAHHLNQNAVFSRFLPARFRIGERGAMSVGLNGRVFGVVRELLDRTSEHYRFHEYMELHFWDQFRRTTRLGGRGRFAGQVPTILQYNMAVFDAARYAGYSDLESLYMTLLARGDQMRAGIRLSDEIEIEYRSGNASVPFPISSVNP